MTQKNYKVGDAVKTRIILNQRRLIGGKYKQVNITVKGKIKKIDSSFGHQTYTISEGKCDDFTTRTIV